MKKLSITDTNTQALLQMQVRDLICWSEMQYSETVYEAGLLYLKCYMLDEEVYADIISRSGIFWSWWKLQWASRDEEFINKLGSVTMNVPLLREIYYELNNAEALAGSIHPNSTIMHESYSEMIKLLIENERKMPEKVLKKQRF